MATYIGLLRAVNLPGHNKIAMADLRDVLTRLGMRDVVTLLQSGNFVCRSDVRSSPELERLIEETATKQLGLITDVLVRSDKEWNTLIAESTDAAPTSPTRLYRQIAPHERRYREQAWDAAAPRETGTAASSWLH